VHSLPFDVPTGMPRRRDLRVCEPHDVVEDADLTLGRLEGVERRSQRVAIDQPVPLTLARPAVHVVEGDLDAAALTVAADVQAGIHQDAVNPGRRGCLAAESVAMRERPQIGLLHEVIHVLAADESCRHTAELPVGMEVGVAKRVCHVIS
jgi:hypothetical protein